jgi:hypothetical protein
VKIRAPKHRGITCFAPSRSTVNRERVPSAFGVLQREELKVKLLPPNQTAPSIGTGGEEAAGELLGARGAVSGRDRVAPLMRSGRGGMWPPKLPRRDPLDGVRHRAGEGS